MNEQAQIEKALFEYIKKNAHQDVSRVNTKTMLFLDGVLDSMGFILLIDFLEEKFAIKTQDEDLLESNFESISAITQYISRKQNFNPN